MTFETSAVSQGVRESNILQKEEYTLDDARNSNVI